MNEYNAKRQQRTLSMATTRSDFRKTEYTPTPSALTAMNQRYGKSIGAVHRTAITAITAVVSMTLSCGAFAESGAIRLFLAETNLMVQVRGDPDDDWHIQSSPDLVNWVTVTNVHTLLSGGPNAPILSVATTSQHMIFYRALKTGGLFDPTLLRTFSLTFTQANWQTQLANGRTKGTNAWPRLINAIYVFNNTPTNLLREKAEEVLAVDRWLWFFALENIFADDDSYWNKGADYMFYYEPESGRIHPVEHDGNESFVQGDASLSPVRGLGDSNRPLINRLLSIPELRQRYIAHMRTVIEEYFNPPIMNALIDRFVAVSVAAIAADPKKGYTSMATYTNDLNSLKTFITNRYKYLTNYAELKLAPPNIVAVHAPTSDITAGQVPFVTAQVVPNASDGIDSVWLYHRGKPCGKFSCAQMFDDGAHGDGMAGDGIFGAQTTNYPAGTKVRFYIEARSANSSKTASFSPPRAEQKTWSYRVALVTAPSTPVVINEIMADNQTAFTDPQGEFDDWIELHNLTDQEIDMSGRYLSDEPNNPCKWQFPVGTKIPADGYLIVWADENGSDTPGLHASFKLSKSGEELFLTDTDANYNAVLDHVVFAAQQTDVSYGRSAANPDVWTSMTPTPGEANR